MSKFKAIAEMLSSGPLTASSIMEKSADITRHDIKRMRREGVLRIEKTGETALYSINEDIQSQNPLRFACLLEGHTARLPKGRERRQESTPDDDLIAGMQFAEQMGIRY